MKLPSGYYRKGGMTVESTKERILETALTLFARNGYLGTSMSDIAGALGISTDQVNVKATTEEGLGFTGTEEGISSQAICALSSFYEGSFTVADSAAGCAGCGGCGRSVQ